MASLSLQGMTDALLCKYQDILGKNSQKNNITLEEIVEEITKYYHLIIDCMPGNVYWLNKDCITIGCNKNVLDMFGLKSADAFKGLSFEQMGAIGKWSQEATESFKRDTMEVIASGKPKLNIPEPPIPHADGRIIYFLSSRVPLINYQGEIIGIVGISIDISELRETQESLKKTKEELEAANQALFLMAGSIAHELRTPLLAISNSMGGILKYFPKLLEAYTLAHQNNLPIDFIPKPQISSLKLTAEAIRTEIDSANLIINMLLVKIRKPETHEQFYTLSINSCIKNALARYPFSSSEKSLIFWKENTDFEFQGNELLITHILFNLLKNSLHYLKAAGKGNIEIWTEKGSKINKLFFKDTGKGISAANLPNIFNQFYSKTQGGTGLGLAFCKSVMEELGGEINCSSIENEYTLFTLSFPINKETQAEL